MTTGSEPLRVTLVTDILPGYSKDGATTYLENVISGLSEQGAVVRVAVPDCGRYLNKPVFHIPNSLIRQVGDVSIRNYFPIGPYFIKLDIVSVIIAFFASCFKFLIRNQKAIDYVQNVVERLRRWRRVKRQERRISAGSDLPNEMQRFKPNQRRLQWMLSYLESHPTDVVIVNYLWLVDYLSLNPAGSVLLKTILTYDIFHRRHESLKQIDLPDEWPMTKEQELAIWSKADVLLAIQSDEAQVMQELVPDSKVLLCRLTARPRWNADFEVTPNTCLFVGSRAYPNVDALRWFLETIWPKVLNLSANTQLHVAGSVYKSFGDYQRMPGVTWHGVLPDLTQIYQESAIVICPLRCGSGLKIKVIEAFSYGKAVIGTTPCAQGLDDARACGALSIRDDPIEFAQILHEYLVDKSKRKLTEDAVRQFTLSNLNPHRTYAALVDSLSVELSQVRLRGIASK